ncbi:MAG: biotin/lipoyl-containing protein [Candidatus Hatepunaea meridiana]|nr:biotin/lipoyl-containing protein [Candidatus Hatepunaea meridiana]
MKIHRFKIFGHNYETKVVRRDDTEIVISVNGQEYKAYLQPSKSTKMARPTPKVVRPKTAATPGTKITAKPNEPKGAGVIKTPMPGLVVKINVKLNDEVKIGQPVIIVEAMKMQNVISANVDGIVTAISVNEGDSVLEGQELVIIGN